MPVAFRSASAATAAASAVTVTAPAGIVNNDLLLAVMGVANGGTSWAQPAGFTELFDTGLGGGGIPLTYAAAWKLASGESGDYTFTAAAGNPAVAAILVFSGVALTGAVDDNDAATITIAASPRTYTCPASTTTVADCLIVRVAFGANSYTSSTGPAAYTERADQASGDGQIGVAAYTIDTNQASIGTTGTADITVTAGGTTGGAAATFAIAPSTIVVSAATGVWGPHSYYGIKHRR